MYLSVWGYRRWRWLLQGQWYSISLPWSLAPSTNNTLNEWCDTRPHLSMPKASLDPFLNHIDELSQSWDDRKQGIPSIATMAVSEIRSNLPLTLWLEMAKAAGISSWGIANGRSHRKMSFSSVNFGHVWLSRRNHITCGAFILYKIILPEPAFVHWIRDIIFEATLYQLQHMPDCQTVQSGCAMSRPSTHPQIKDNMQQ